MEMYAHFKFNLMHIINNITTLDKEKRNKGKGWIETHLLVNTKNNDSEKLQI